MLEVSEDTLAILKNINFESKVYETYKHEILNEFIEKNKHLAVQGSPAWLADRVYSIGGSEMSTITGENPYSNIEKLVALKTGFSKFSGNIATRWGKLFEFTTQMITSIIFDINIKETGSLEGAVPSQKYSPDGLAVMKVQFDETINNERIETNEFCIVLFEFKSPLLSIPDGSIPKHYLPQVKTGLCSIGITDFALYISNMFRKCSFGDLDLSAKYDTYFHNKDAQKINVERALAFGVIIFYKPDCQSAEAPKDFGLSNYYEFNEVLELFENKTILAKYCKPHILAEYNNNEFLQAQNINKGNDDYSESLKSYKEQINGIPEGKIIGYLPWKLIKSDIIYQQREVGYVEKYIDVIQSTIDIIKKINQSDDRAAEFISQFPKNKIFKNYMEFAHK